MFHPYAWLLWVATAALAAFLTRNPLYLLLIGGSVALVYNDLPGRRSPLAQSWMGLVKLGALVTLFAVPMNLLTVHTGRYVMVTLPAQWPVIGGPLTLEALLFGLTTSFSLVVILLIFATLNVALDQSVFLRLAPPFLLEAGVIVAIAVSFVPQMVRSAQEIREAQLIRGRQRGGVRDLGPLFLALLTTGLERSMTLAESMESRGFGGAVQPRPLGNRLWLQAIALLCLTGLAVSLFLAQYRAEWATGAWVGAALAGIGLAIVLWRQGQGIERSRYTRLLWRRRDTALGVSSAALLLALIGARIGWSGLMIYYPYPPNPAWPAFNLWLGALLLLLAMPVWLSPTPAPEDVESAQPRNHNAGERIVDKPLPAPGAPALLAEHHPLKQR